MVVWSRVAVNVQVVHSCACLADWELAVHPERASYRLLPAQESSKPKIQNTVSKECILLSHHLKIVIQTVVNQGPSVDDFSAFHLGEAMTLRFSPVTIPLPLRK